MVPTAPIHHLVALPLDSQTYTSYPLLKSSGFYPNYSLSHFNLPPHALPILVPYNDPILPLHILEADINKKVRLGGQHDHLAHNAYYYSLTQLALILLSPT